MRNSVDNYDPQKQMKNVIKRMRKNTNIRIKKAQIVAEIAEAVKEFILTDPIACQFSARIYGDTMIGVETNGVKYEDVITTIGAFLHQKYGLLWRLHVSRNHLRLTDTLNISYRGEERWPPRLEVDLMIYEGEETTCPIVIEQIKTNTHTYDENVYAIRCQG